MNPRPLPILATLLLVPVGAAERSRPNILFLFADDWGMAPCLLPG